MSVDYRAIYGYGFRISDKEVATLSDELYDERYSVKEDVVRNTKGQSVYKFSIIGTNLSSGKKQGEISCFDIAYTLFADKESILGC